MGCQKVKERTKAHMLSQQHGQAVASWLALQGKQAAKPPQQTIAEGVAGMSDAVLKGKRLQMITIMFLLQLARPLSDFAKHREFQMLLGVAGLATSHWSQVWPLSESMEDTVRGAPQSQLFQVLQYAGHCLHAAERSAIDRQVQ